MSFMKMDQVSCACGETFEWELYQSVTVEDDPDLRERVLAGEINLVRCPSCFRMFYAERFLLYHDSSRQLMAFVYPAAREPEAQTLKAEMERTFQEMQAGMAKEERLKYAPIMTFGLEALTRLLNLEQDMEDEADVARAFCDQLKIPFRRVPGDLARDQGIPTVLPLGKPSRPDRDNVLAGLKRLLAANDRLSRYRELLARMESDPGWSP